MHFLFLHGHFVVTFHKHSKSRILQKEFAVNMHETPKQTIPDFLPGAFFEIAQCIGNKRFQVLF